ncbi:MAG: hypothetical protein M1155_01800 [Patescibacteria group bacterium]|nr:hypothetical protein [Patescibacteria group bacterium]
MSKLNKILLAIVIVLLVVLAFMLWKPDVAKMVSGGSYYAVYLTSGDLYFGKMVWYSPDVLTDVYLIQTNQATSKDQPQLKLVKFSDAVWGPSDELKINEKDILWKTKLSANSQVLKLINGSQQ